MYIVLLKFSDNKIRAGEFMQAHNAWIKQGFDDRVFLMVGSLQPNLGGGVLVHGLSLSELQQRLAADPFVVERIVTAEIIEMAPARVDERLKAIFG